MKIKRLLTIACVGIIVLAFSATPLHAKPGKNNGKAKGQVHKPEKDHPKGNKAIKAASTERDHTIKKDKDASQAKALRPNIQKHIEQNLRKNEQKLIKDLNQSLLKLSQSNWAYHPRDERGQGNMGKVDMLDPYGHDKDSDRMALYGNRGRVIREVIEPEPEPEPEPVPEPEPEPQPEPEPEPDPDPIPEFPF